MWSTNQDGIGFIQTTEGNSTQGSIPMDHITVQNFKLKNLTVKNHTTESFAAGIKHNQDSNEFIKVESSLESSTDGRNAQAKHNNIFSPN